MMDEIKDIDLLFRFSRTTYQSKQLDRLESSFCIILS